MRLAKNPVHPVRNHQNLALWASHRWILKYSLSMKFIGHRWQNNLFSKSLCMSLTWYLSADRLLYTCLQWGHGKLVRWNVLLSPAIPFFTVPKSLSAHFEVPAITSGFSKMGFLSFFNCFALNKLILASLLMRLSLLLFAFRKNISTLGVSVRFSASHPPSPNFVSFFENIETSGFGTFRMVSSPWSECPSPLLSAM